MECSVRRKTYQELLALQYARQLYLLKSTRTCTTSKAPPLQVESGSVKALQFISFLTMSGHGTHRERRGRPYPSQTPLQSKMSSTTAQKTAPQPSISNVMSNSILQAPQLHAAAIPMQASPVSPGQAVSATTTTTMTTTTHHTGQPSSILTPPNAQLGADVLNKRLQNMHIQHKSIEQHTPSHAERSMPPFVTSPIGTSQSQQHPLPQPVTKPRTAIGPGK